MSTKSSRSKGYASQSIGLRRFRILEETRKIIAEKGTGSFSMDEICKRAGVARRTLYNIFQSKEGMIAAAISQYFDKYVVHSCDGEPEKDLISVIRRMVAMANRNLEVRHYSHVLIGIYHSPDIDECTWRAIHTITLDSHKGWIAHLRDNHKLQSWADADKLAHNLTRYRYAIGISWMQGHLKDEDFVLHLVSSVLEYMVGPTRGSARREIEDLLRLIKTSGKLPAFLRSSSGLRLRGAEC